MHLPLWITIALPAAAGLVAALIGGRLGRAVAVLGSLAVAVIALDYFFSYPFGSGSLKHVVDEPWIPQLGVRFRLGLDGLSLALFAMTAVAWLPATVWSVLHRPERERQYLFLLGLGEAAVLGAFAAQDLALFVVFFDLMLLPFYLLIGSWGTGQRVRATTLFVVYTLVGSLLMLAAAIALAVLATPAGSAVSFSLADLANRPLDADTQKWVFALFALAFLIKAPAFPLHAWAPAAYRAAPWPVAALLSAVLSKVGVYGFLRLALPLLPQGVETFQVAIVVVAVASILYGSVMALIQDNVRLVAVYSSIAQLGFITLGIFSLDPKGAQGAVFQMVNHGLVSVPLFLILAAVAARAGGSESLRELGGLAVRAPVLATVFLLVALSNLAMPGTPNFVGELFVLFGALDGVAVAGFVASVGVALAAAYTLRLFQRTMHNPPGQAVTARELGRGELAALVPIVAAIVALGVYPQALLGRAKAASAAPVAQVVGASERSTR
ncbi:complex I subunit 4 family protein [Thermoleophilum album]|uniref:NADH-quinone oxidoreductase subunit M n=1 Tax=Thermoleophilum album TaxID=29539 RepID=A0A1H6FLE3_THEAL|nr:NADH-quinone oxidoreductase subunit M [Thermoleophilum album]SEH10614.1 NADH-quinone oxidoreductase subunit M [Thermoleophilum album]